MTYDLFPKNNLMRPMPELPDDLEEKVIARFLERRARKARRRKMAFSAAGAILTLSLTSAVLWSVSAPRKEPVPEVTTRPHAAPPPVVAPAAPPQAIAASGPQPPAAPEPRRRKPSRVHTAAPRVEIAAGTETACEAPPQITDTTSTAPAPVPAPPPKLRQWRDSTLLYATDGPDRDRDRGAPQLYRRPGTGKHPPAKPGTPTVHEEVTVTPPPATATQEAPPEQTPPPPPE